MLALASTEAKNKALIASAESLRRRKGEILSENAKDMEDGTCGKLFLCNGIELDTNDNDSYDLVYSTITMQHIPVYDIRLNYLREFYRVLRAGGWVSIQMCFGIPKSPSVSYYENAYDAKGTNGECDVMISDVSQIKDDLELVGFSKEYTTVGGSNVLAIDGTESLTSLECRILDKLTI